MSTQNDILSNFLVKIQQKIWADWFKFLVIVLIFSSVPCRIHLSTACRYFSSERNTSIRNFFLFHPSFFSYLPQMWYRKWNERADERELSLSYRTDYEANRGEEINIYLAWEMNWRILVGWRSKWSEARYRKYSIWYLCRLRHVRLRWAGNRVHGWCALDTGMRQNWFSGKPDRETRRKKSCVFADTRDYRTWFVSSIAHTCD